MLGVVLGLSAYGAVVFAGTVNPRGSYGGPASQSAAADAYWYDDHYVYPYTQQTSQPWQNVVQPCSQYGSSYTYYPYGGYWGSGWSVAGVGYNMPQNAGVSGVSTSPYDDPLYHWGWSIEGR